MRFSENMLEGEVTSHAAPDFNPRGGLECNRDLPTTNRNWDELVSCQTAPQAIMKASAIARRVWATSESRL